MANAFSQLRQYGDYISPYDFNTIQSGLNFKQSKFDANMLKIQAEIDNFSKLDLVRDIDKQYVATKLQSLVNSTNNMGSMDLSSNGITRNIMSKINEVQDEHVINALVDTKKYRAKINTISTIREKHQDKYSDINAMEVMEGINKWINGGVNDRLNAADYTPYVNVKSKYNKLFKDLVSNKEKEFDLPVYDSKGNIVKGSKRRVKIKGMTDSEIRSILNSQLTTQEIKQLELNGKWLYSKQLGADKTFEKFGNSLKSKIEKLKIIKNSKNSTKIEKERALRGLEELDSFISNVLPTSDDSENVVINKSYIAGKYLAKNNIINSISSMYHTYEAKNHLMKDEIYFANLNSQTAIEKLAWDKEKFKYKESVKVTKKGEIIPNGEQELSNITITPQSDKTLNVNNTKDEYESKKKENYSKLQVAQNNLLYAIPIEQQEVFINTAKKMNEMTGVSEFDALNSILKPYVINKEDKDNDTYSNFAKLLKEREDIANIAKVSYKDSFNDLEESLTSTVPYIKEYFNSAIKSKFEKFLGFDPTNDNLTSEEKSELMLALAAETLPGLQNYGKTDKFFPLVRDSQKVKFNYIANKFDEIPKYNGDRVIESSIPKTLEYFKKANKNFIGRQQWATGIGDDNLLQDSSANKFISKFDEQFDNKFNEKLQQNLAYFNDKVNVNIAPAMTNKEYSKNTDLVKANRLFTESIASNVVQYIDKDGNITNELPSKVDFDIKSGATIKMNFTKDKSLIINGNTRLLVPTNRVSFYFGDGITKLNTDDGKAIFVPDFNVNDVTIPKPSMKLDVSNKRIKYIKDKYSSVEPLAVISEDKSLYLDDKIGLLKGIYNYSNGKPELNNIGKAYKYIIDNMDTFNMDINYSKDDLKNVYIDIFNGDTKIGNFKYSLYNNSKSNKEALSKIYELSVDAPRVFLLRMLQDINKRGDSVEELSRIINTLQKN